MDEFIDEGYDRLMEHVAMRRQLAQKQTAEIEFRHDLCNQINRKKTEFSFKHNFDTTNAGKYCSELENDLLMAACSANSLRITCEELIKENKELRDKVEKYEKEHTTSHIDLERGDREKCNEHSNHDPLNTSVSLETRCLNEKNNNTRQSQHTLDDIFNPLSCDEFEPFSADSFL